MLQSPSRAAIGATATAVRFYSTRVVANASVNYRPGKEGFAPGVPHPPGSSDAPSPKPEPRTLQSLPSMSKKHSRKANGTPTQKFEHQMTKLRHQYLREHVKSQDEQRAQDAKFRTRSLQRLQERQASDRAENEKRKQFERMIQPEGEDFGEAKKQRIQEFVAARQIQRDANYAIAQERASEARMDAMIRLYHSAENFVTMENLDAKVHEFYENGLTKIAQLPNHQVDQMVTMVEEYGGQVSYPDLLKREVALKDALDGTVSGGKIGLDAVKVSSV